MFWQRPSLLFAAFIPFSLALDGAPGGSAVQAQTLGDVVQASQDQAARAQGAQTAARTAGTPSVAGVLFGSTEFESKSLKGLPQWTRVLAEMEQERAPFQACARDAGKCTSPTLRNWNRVITAATPLDRAGKIRMVNEFFNRWPYKEDRELYGRNEYWAAPREFMARSGDCEDYSIAKYFALRELGFGEEEMRVVILMDEIRGIGHAVLAIYEEDEILILDSLSNMILPHDRYKHYRPQYSMNETTRWAHVGGFDKTPSRPYRGLVARRDTVGDRGWTRQQGSTDPER